MLLIEETNAAEQYERKKFDFYKDNIFPVLTLTYVLMDNLLSLFFTYLHAKFQEHFQDWLILSVNTMSSVGEPETAPLFLSC